MNLGVYLKKHRVASGMTQQQLAEKIGVAPSAISLFERNIRVPDYYILRLYVKTFNMDVGALFDIKDRTSGYVLKETPTTVYSKDDVDLDTEILQAIWSNHKVYDRLLKNPKLVVKIMDLALAMIETYNREM